MNKHNLSSWISPTNVATSNDDEAKDTGTTDAANGYAYAYQQAAP